MRVCNYQVKAALKEEKKGVSKIGGCRPVTLNLQGADRSG